MKHPVVRMIPTGSDVLTLVAAAAFPLVMGAAPDPSMGMDFQKLILPMIMSAAAAIGGIMGKAAVVGFWAFVRAKGHAMLGDKDKANDILGQALIDTSDRMDPMGAEVTPIRGRKAYVPPDPEDSDSLPRPPGRAKGPKP